MSTTNKAKRWTRAVLHIDMDAFYASVEQRDRPELRGKCVVIGGDGPRSVVSTCSYEARKFGVKSAMPGVLAKRLCPQAIFLPPRMSHYVEVSKKLMQILGRYSPTVEPLSLDEAFLDATGTEALFGTAAELAWAVQRAVREELALPCSVGVASNKFVAKVASDFKKPAGIVVVQPGEERTFLAEMSIDRLWGVGPKTAERLRADGYTVIADVAAADAKELQRRYGGLGEHLHALANGHDDRPVDDERERKSLGAERTLDVDITGIEAVRRQVAPLIEEVAFGLRKANLRAGGIRLKLKYSDFHRVSREQMLNEPALDAVSIRAAIEQLLVRADVDRPIRLVGLAATHLVAADAPRQASLFEAPQTARSEALGRALDAINGKLGKGSIVRGTLTRRLDDVDRGVEHLDFDE